MFDPDDSFDAERRIERDFHREPVRVQRHRRPLDPTGTLRARFDPDAAPATEAALDILRRAGAL